MKRLFIAVPVIPEPSLLDILAVLKKSLRTEKINWVLPQNLHFTLQFLGDTREEHIPAISDRIREVSLRHKKMTGKLTGIGFFSRQRVPQVIFTNLEGAPEIQDLAGDISQEMQSLGFTPDFRDFKPHLTLGRIRYLKNKSGFYQLADTWKQLPVQPFYATEIVLYESILRPEGPVYRPLSAHQLP